MSKTFIDRPIFAWVIAIIIMLVGIGAITAFFALSNRLANFTGMRPNDEFYLMGRLPKQ